MHPMYARRNPLQVTLGLALVAAGFLLGCEAHPRVRSCEDVTSGKAGCPCASDSDCALYLTCSSGMCFDIRVPPAEPLCYTPCRAGALIDGVYRSCTAQGLMEGCVSGATCERGSCVASASTPRRIDVESDAGAAELEGMGMDGLMSEAMRELQAPPTEPRRCHDELGCASHQTCIEGYCYSQCRRSDECRDGYECYRHVCRLPCATSQSGGTCPKNSFCASIDGENGYCEQNPAHPEGEHSTVVGRFELSPNALSFSNVTDAASFSIHNHSPAPMEFVVARVAHREFDDSGTRDELDLPLFWLDVVEGGIEACRRDRSPTTEDDPPPGLLRVLVPGEGGEATISICNAGNEQLLLWTGTIEVGNEQLGYRNVSLSYNSTADGQWQGNAYYFANFGTDRLEAWTTDKEDTQLLGSVGNALIWRWGAMRRGQISLDNFQAALRSAITGSWSSATMQARCPEQAGACYPYDDADGLESFSNDLSRRPIPTGVAELPVTMNLAVSRDGASQLQGRFDSAGTLHYAGDPAVNLTLSLPSDACDARFSDACLNFVRELEASIVVGGRYYPAADSDSCHVPGFELLEVPWLVPGFDASTRELPGGLRYRRECRATAQPFANSMLRGLNKVFAGANPIPDGRARQRELKLIDGMLINQAELLLLFEERFNLGDAGDPPMIAHGVMRLSRAPATLKRDDFEGNVQRDTAGRGRDLSPPVRCSERVVRQALNRDSLPAAWTPVPSSTGDINDLARALITGKAPGNEVLTLDVIGHRVHYLCHDTGLFDGGSGDHGGPGATAVECPRGSRVTYFSLIAGPNCGDQAAIAALPCQSDGTCERYLFESLPAAQGCQLRMRPQWACADDARYCDDNRTNLRAGKVFYAGSETAVFLPLHNAVDESFRYKTAFVSRKDRNLGFVPAICAERGNSIPYCYDPGAIEAVKARVDCALSLYVNHFDALSDQNRAELRQALEIDFAVEPGLTQRDGFESLFAELAIMLGDDAYTAAFAARFDLAGTQRRAFEGELFEEDGINLSGVAGYEMYSLYLATQYYQLALDRFYALMPLVRESLAQQRAGNTADGFITQESVTIYFDRLIRASSQKSRAWSEVAKRYQGFNEPKLARRVVERAYTATYLESVLIARLMHEVSDVVRASEVAQIERSIEQSLRLYNAALLEMRDVYDSIRDEVTFFGYPADYIPFPALDPGDVNAFQKLMTAAWEAADFARDKEERALAKARDFDVDEESFQSELVSIRNNYEGQLGELCGLFPMPPMGEQYLPAIAKYAHWLPETAQLGDPCGSVGTGTIHDGIVLQGQRVLELEGLILRRENKQREMEIELTRIDAHCSSVLGGIDAIRGFETARQVLSTVIKAGDTALSIYDIFRETGQAVVENAHCIPPTGGLAVSPGNCLQVSLAITARAAANKTYKALQTALKVGRFAAEESVAIAKTALDIAGLEGQCDLARIDSAARFDVLALQKSEIEHDILVKVEALALAEAQVEALRNQAKRLQIEQAEAEQLAINIEAARNDPNVRIYKNDAVISAERSFRRALTAAYKATKVYEYYTSQSYPRLQNLFLIRMVQAGDFDLEEYLFELEGAYTGFQESFGNPDHRVAIISLRDDIWAIPRVDGYGQSFSEDQRHTQLRRQLTDPRLLDSRGHTTIPFSTSLDVLSPLTRNHKIRHIEAEFVGTDVGDALGRIYLRQRGTGTLHSVGGERLFYALPAKTAVVDTFFNGERFGVFSDDRVLRSERFRDLPFANTAWELVINQRDEHVNQDINLQSLSDIRLYIYYTDFTEL